MMLSEETSAVRPQKQTRFNGAKLVWMLKGSPLTVTGAVIIVLMLLMMIFSPWLATHDPNAIDLQCENVPALTACGDNNQRCACWYPQQEVISV